MKSYIEFQSLLQGIEATRLDYKLSLETEKPKSWLKTVSAFANTQGGHIVFGVTDKTHEAVGVVDAQITASRIAEFITAQGDLTNAGLVKYNTTYRGIR